MSSKELDRLAVVRQVLEGRLTQAKAADSAQLGQLRAIFPDGVCDYRRPGVEQQPLQAAWLTYPGGGDVRELGGDDDGDRDD